MTNLKYYYAKLSCPDSDDGQVFLNLFNSLKKDDFFEFKLKNIPNNLENASINDVIFINIGGDSSNKKKYFRDKIEFNNYTNGIHSIGFIKEIKVKEKEVIVSIIGLKEIVTKEDLYFFPQFINNLGASTKGTPNQAGLYLLDETTAFSLIDYLKKRNILSLKFILPEELMINNNLFSVALKDYNDNFKEKELTQKIFQKYTGASENEKKISDNNLLIREFVKWFNLKENYKSSYKGIVNEENLLFWDSVYFNSELFNIGGENKIIIYEKISAKINNLSDPKWDDFNFSSSKGAPKAVLGERNYLKFLKLYLDNKWEPKKLELISFNVSLFDIACKKVGLKYDFKFINRFVSSLITKPFVILSGLSGSGKTKLAQAFVQWICENKEQYKIVPVGADWTNREPLLGYPNGLVAEEYITPDSGVINLLMNAVKKENQNKPFFLILDEMNLSHVERYFADFLSIMESDDTIKLYTGSKRKSLDGLEIDLEISWPKNVFIIGTVNIDETTYMFSPKVLDRANVIEFRITETEIESFLDNPSTPDLSKLTKQGVSMAESFLSIAHSDAIVKNEKLAKELVSFFKQLQVVGAEFGYRSASEIMQLVSKLKMLDKTISDNSCLDIAIMQKLLPKLHGSRSKLVKILIALSGLCIGGIATEEFEKKFDDYYKNDFEGLTIKYPISFEKIIRMYKNVLTNGFTSYAEA